MVEPERAKPDFREMTALWFGHVSNLTYLLDYMANQMHLHHQKPYHFDNMPKEAIREELNEHPKT